jgi:light-regulated signal transduction histidine kinase (bacteriophytochrome)
MSITANEEKQKKEILIVDDTPDNLRLLSAILTKKKYDVRKSLNSKQAISSIKAHAPDLILLDIKMPEIDGYETCMALKQDPETCMIPVIFISALDDAVDKVKAFSVGGADYVSKPFQEAEVLARIEHQIHLRDLQCQLETQNQKLIQSNQELENFAHIVSHDLQQPLQSIMGYAKIITIQYPALLDTEANQYVKKILEAGDRMRRLIQNLLDCARAEQTPEIFTPLDGNILLETAMQDLSNLIEESGADISFGKLPKLLGNEAQLVQLFENILGNALKFSRTEKQPKIHIESSKTTDGNCLLCFQDNGIGIPEDGINDIFKKFHRMHSNQKYPGLGIGLATCKKIVEHHKGSIWVESKVSVGTSFYIRLPMLVD